MRLSKEERRAILDVFKETFGSGSIYLFGSRVDDRLKGGDIDLYIDISKSSDRAGSFEKRCKIMIKEIFKACDLMIKSCDIDYNELKSKDIQSDFFEDYNNTGIVNSFLFNFSKLVNFYSKTKQ